MTRKKSVLLSVKAVYAELLISGVKTVELRRRFPLDLPVGTTLFIYSSGGEQVVIGKCAISGIERLRVDELWKAYSRQSVISWEDFVNYFEGCEFGYAIHVNKPIRFDQPIRLADLDDQKTLTRPPQSYCYI